MWAFNVDKIETFAFINNAFSDSECESIIRLGNTKLVEATVVNPDGSGATSSLRKSRVHFMEISPETMWIYDRMSQLTVNLNSQYFNFDLTGFHENLQYTEYASPSGYYDYHVDRLYNKGIRKLSVVLQLTNEADYEGGELVIYDGGDSTKDIIKLPKTRGTLVAFPSFMLHKVMPVTSGVRNSLVGWTSGPQFK